MLREILKKMASLLSRSKDKDACAAHDVRIRGVGLFRGFGRRDGNST